MKTMVIFQWGKSLLLGVKTLGFETDFDEAKLILQIGCPSCHQTIKNDGINST